MRSFIFLFVALFLIGCDTKTKEERELEERYALYKKINKEFKPQEIVEVETPIAIEGKKTNNDQLFLIHCTKDSLFSVYLKKHTNFANPAELKDYLFANIARLQNKKFGIKASEDASYDRIQKIIEVLQDSLLDIKTFSLITDIEKFD
jgi:biopolymer transport protein ExbD